MQIVMENYKSIYNDMMVSTITSTKTSKPLSQAISGRVGYDVVYHQEKVNIKEDL
jgi:hypothetical protein